MDLIQALILSLIEGTTEFLPISSTGHLLLASRFLNIPQTEFVKTFEIFIQLGAILAIVVLYWRQLSHNFAIYRNIVIAFIPTGVIGLVFYRIIKQVFFENILITVFALLVGGILLIVLEKLYDEKGRHIDSIEKLSLKQSFLIGVAQSFSIIPGTSRAAATIIGGLLAGAKRKVAVEFSFLLAIPTMAGATGLDLIKSEFKFDSQEILVLSAGFIGSFATALLVVKWFIRFIENNNFFWFGVYRIVLSIALLLVLA